MSEIRTLFRSCPNCGKRFEIHLTGKVLLKSETVSDDIPMPMPVGSMPSSFTPLEQGKFPVVLEEEEFQYAYECKHCGHKWFEVVNKEEKIG